MIQEQAVLTYTTLTHNMNDTPAGLSQRSDDELMLLARAGHSEAFDEIVRRHQGRAMRVAAKHLGEAAAAREATQRAFVQVYSYLPRYQARGRFSQFLFHILQNQCRMLQRSARTRRAALEKLAEMPRAAEPLPDEQLLARERLRNVENAVTHLSDKLRAVVRLRYKTGLPYTEIAKALGVPVGTVKSRLAAGMEKLRQQLDAQQA